MTRTTDQHDRQVLLWLGMFALYFGIQAAIRIILGQGLNIDEAEAWLWSQRLDRGYGPQPPAYIWLQRLVFTFTGVSVTGLALLKAVLLWSITAASFVLARRLTYSNATALLAVLLLMWLPEFSWESQRIRTHNTLAALISLTSVIILLELRKHPQPWRYTFLGFLFGLGLLSKWNFGLIIPPVLFALVISDWRTYLFRPAALWLLILPALMVLPTTNWMYDHPEVAFASSGKLGLSEPLTYAQKLSSWLGAFFESFAAYAALPIVVFIAFSITARSQKSAKSDLANQEEAKVIILVVAFSTLLLLVLGVVVGASQLKSRWFFPMTAPLIPVAGAWLVERLSPRIRKTYVGMTAVLAGLLIAGTVYNLRVTPPVDLSKIAETASNLAPIPSDELIVAPVVMAANLQLITDSRNIIDVPMLLTGPCPRTVWLLAPNDISNETVGGFLDGCKLVTDHETGLIDIEQARRFIPAPN